MTTLKYKVPLHFNGGKELVTEIKIFKTPADLMNTIDSEIEHIKTLLEQYMARLEEQKKKIEQIKKLSESLSKLLGRKTDIGSVQEVNIMGLSFIVNPSPKQEVDAIEEVIKNLNDKLIVLQKIKKALESLGLSADAELNLAVTIINDIPTKIMMKIS